MSKNRKSFKQRRREGIKNKVISALRNAGNTPQNYKQIGTSIGMTQAREREDIIKVLYELLEAGQIDEVSKGKYLFKPSKDYFVGVMDITSSGKGYVMVEDLDEDILIKNKNLNKSFDGDTVRVYQFRRRNNGKREGEVVEII